MALSTIRKIIVTAMCSIVLMGILAACGGGSEGSSAVAPPRGGAGYRYRPPADLQDGWRLGDISGTVQATALETLMAAVAAGEFPDLDSLVIAQGGELLFEVTLRRELDNFDQDIGNTDLTRHAQFSVSKSLASVMTGVAIEQGFIESVYVPYLDFFPYTDYANWDERKTDITLEDVLTMRLGLDWNEWEPPYDRPDNQLFRFHDTHHDWSKALLDLPMAYGPGEHFAYNTIASTSLGQAIENAAPLSLVDFANTHVVEVMELRDLSVWRTPTGLPDLGRGLFLYTRDIAKFGQMMLEGGTWNTRRLVSPSWVDASTRAHFELSWSEPESWDWQVDGYGYQWWIGHFDLDGRRLDTFSAEGHGGQLTMVIPELQLVIAINSHAYDLPREDPNELFRLIRERLLPAFATAP